MLQKFHNPNVHVIFLCVIFLMYTYFFYFQLKVANLVKSCSSSQSYLQLINFLSYFTYLIVVFIYC